MGECEGGGGTRREAAGGGGRRRKAAEGGGRRRKADTELKTKTSHVNVGKNITNNVGARAGELK